MRNPEAKEAPEAWRRGLRWAGAAEASGAGHQLLAGAEIRAEASFPAAVCGRSGGGAGRPGRGRGGQLPELCPVRRCGCSRALAASASLTTHGLAAGLPLDLRPFWAPEPMRARAPPPLLQLSCNPGAPGAGGGMTAA